MNHKHAFINASLLAYAAGDSQGLTARRSLATQLHPCRITTGPDSKAAMNRPKRFRGLATDPGVQRKAPRTVIQRENKPKGPRLEEQLIQAGDGRQ
ncbi:hypothetical protein [Pseudomonas carnis]|uniref:hypothetical protein n=1 Tax=Pseudomonas carnis TaxID=2487355 RepID=UPI0019695C92|nr:hypothetical protein [Pseudomonas carnis]